MSITYRFLDGSLETETFSSDDNILDRIRSRVKEWRKDQGLLEKQIVLTDSQGNSVRIHSGNPISCELINVLILPLLSIESLNDREVEELYTYPLHNDTREPCNEDSFRRFARVLWINRVMHGPYVYDTVFYRVKEDHMYNSSSSNVVSVTHGGDGEHPVWEPEIPMTQLAAERWAKLVEQYRAQ